MDGGGEDLQNAKPMTAASYDYANDPRWADYWSNVLIPPHMASRNDVINHFKHKFYQRFIDPELIVEPIASNVTSQPARASVPPSQSSSSSTSNSNTPQSQRNIMQTFMYWQILKLMYNAPATAGYHQSAWTKIGRTLNPLIRRYAPFLNTPMSAVQRWWFR